MSLRTRARAGFAITFARYALAAYGVRSGRDRLGPDQHVSITPDCAKTATATRQANQQEQWIFDLWHKRGLDEANFDVGQLIAFLNEIKHV